MRSLILVVLVACSSSHAQERSRVVIGGEAPAEAPPDAGPPVDEAGKERAKELFMEAQRDYDLGRFDEAAEGFKRAYEEYPDAVFLFDLAQAQRQVGSCAEAAYFYRAFLKRKADLDNRMRHEIEQHIADMDACATGSSPVPEE